MSGPKRNPDKLNTIGIVVVGICGAVLVYVSIVALQAFYVSDTSEIQTMADYGGNDTRAHSLKIEQVRSITTDVGKNAAPPAKPNEAPKPDTFHISIDDAMKLVVESAKVDPSMLVPTQGRADKATIKPIFGRPQPLPTAPPTAPPTDGAGAGSGSAAPATGSPPAAPTSPTGGQGGGGGAATGGNAGSAATAAPAVNLPREAGAGSGSAAKTPEKAPAPAKGNAP